MENVQGFITLNAYALILITLIMIIFYRKGRLHQVEDTTYSFLLVVTTLTTFSGVGLGLMVNPNLNIVPLLIELVNKIYMVFLTTWTIILTFYTYYVSRIKNGEAKKEIKTYLTIWGIACAIILLLPAETSVVDGVGMVTGASVMLTYSLIAICYIVMFVLLILDRKNRHNKKYAPIYLLAFLGGGVFVVQMLTNLNYLINPLLILIVIFMYHTIENPDMKMIEEIHKAKEVTDNSNEEKEMFLYNMTNDIRQITKDIDVEANNILNELSNKKVDTEILNNSAREIKISTAKFTTMTNEILDVSQMDSNIKVYNDKYNAKLIIKELVQIYKTKCTKKGLKFTTNFDSDIPEYLYGDSVGLKKALSVVLDNSVEYTNEGFINFDINVIIKRDIARLVITIEDSGIGMKVEELNKIFSKKETNEEASNLNNNLYNAKRLVVLMGGTIIPNSVYGKGTTIKIILDQKIGENETTYTKYESVYDKKKILLVDDSPTSAKIITKMLKDTNVILDIVETGKEALDKIREKEKYDLILIDEEMQPLSGLDVMKKLKEIRTFNTKTILLTKNNEYEYNDEYLKYGFNDYLLKPLDKDKLFEKTGKYLK